MANHLVLFQFIGGLISTSAIHYQSRYNKIHRSIYGLSYDLYILEFFSHLVSIFCTLQYKFSPLISKQYAERFPLFYPQDDPATNLPISIILLLKDILISISSLAILKQLNKYRSSKHIFQGISIYCITSIIILIIFSILTFTCSRFYLPERNSGKFGIFYIEHINYLWVLGNFLSCCKFFPQISINYMGSSTIGFSSKYLVLYIISILCQFLTLFGDEKPFYRLEFNRTPFFTIIIQFISLMFLLYQAQFLYLNSRPYLPRGK
ncbi:hypothetical protein TBLA_0D04780 [Henningerozyma blattae CBS 6284]|uniref:Uncharacterized protein n=1 Tax=Henningerozyma blattae (strain ATCC 34711 / CBS 6284 / DSM 70876 / NBRC 10599 / NRRL Y-10934 / UCD 77-7) TaxID=1071380 RepID=I2H3M2_HENB6|nr:hypothetical protein TBLA_0D04780 [Tetrapisispora blattae CBS 6284]CCH60974.1 hypothetical protein TBLA_0D04780 [Tetrapisispora blattae CBS 6284]